MKIKNTNLRIFSFVLLSYLLTISSCSENPSEPPIVLPFTTINVNVTAIDKNGFPAAGVEITIEGSTQTTGSDGRCLNPFINVRKPYDVKLIAPILPGQNSKTIGAEYIGLTIDDPKLYAFYDPMPSNQTLTVNIPTLTPNHLAIVILTDMMNIQIDKKTNSGNQIILDNVKWPYAGNLNGKIILIEATLSADGSITGYDRASEEKTIILSRNQGATFEFFNSDLMIIQDTSIKCTISHPQLSSPIGYIGLKYAMESSNTIYTLLDTAISTSSSITFIVPKLPMPNYQISITGFAKGLNTTMGAVPSESKYTVTASPSTSEVQIDLTAPPKQELPSDNGHQFNTTEIQSYNFTYSGTSGVCDVIFHGTYPYLHVITASSKAMMPNLNGLKIIPSIDTADSWQIVNYLDISSTDEFVSAPLSHNHSNSGLSKSETWNFYIHP